MNLIGLKESECFAWEKKLILASLRTMEVCVALGGHIAECGGINPAGHKTTGRGCVDILHSEYAGRPLEEISIATPDRKT